MQFTCRQGIHQHHSEDAANACEACAAAARAYFKAISDAQLRAQGVEPQPNDWRGDGAKIAMAENGLNAVAAKQRGQA